MKAYVRKRVYPSGRVSWLLTKELGEGSDGARDRTYDAFATEKEALKARDLFLGEMAAGTFIRETDLSTGEFLERWLVDHHRRHVGPRAYDRDISVVRKHLVPGLGRIPLAKLRPLDIEHFGATDRRLDGRPLSPASLSKHHWVLHSALECAVDWELIRRNPAAKVRRPQAAQRPAIRALDDDEKRLLLAATTGTSIRGLVLLALATGMRRGEILAMRWADVDLEAGTLAVRSTVLESRRDGVSIKETTKGGRGRQIRTATSTVSFLRRHKAEQNEVRVFCGKSWHNNDLVFPQATGELRRPCHITQAFERIIHACPDCDAPGERSFGDLCTRQPAKRKRHKERRCSRACMSGVRFHDLRHSHATDLLRAGVPVKVVSERLGHASITITLNTYAHVLPDMQDEAARQTDAILARVTGQLA
jgi:integrase